VRAAQRVVAHDAFEERRHRRHPERQVQRHQPRLDHSRGVDHGEAREARGILQSGAHAQVAAERVSDGRAAHDAELLLKLADERPRSRPEDLTPPAAVPRFRRNRHGGADARKYRAGPSG
jgi:hypothetical protein